MWSTLLLGLCIIYTFNYIQKLYRNIRTAQRTNLPYFIVPFSSGLASSTIFTATAWLPHIIKHWLPSSLADRLNDVNSSYRWTTKSRQVGRFGRVYLVVTPAAVLCNVADAEVVAQVVNARGSFPKPVWQYKIIELYGPNLVTCEDAQWARHRRQTATTFNEKNNELVWNESIRLVKGMTEYWKESSPVDVHNEFTVKNTRDDILRFALNVFCAGAFGVEMPFKRVPRDSVQGPFAVFQDTITPPEGFDFTFRSAVAYMNEKIATVAFANLVIPNWMPRVLFPFLKRDFAAYSDLENYLKMLIATEDEGNRISTSNLIEGMLRHRRDGKMSSSSAKENALSDREILSNAHIFTLAGHETAATTLRYALVLLALHQNAQEWAYQGILEATEDEPPDIADWEYASVYPKLVTPLCVMLETMRLYPPVVTVPKWTGDGAKTIHYQGEDILLEKEVNVNLNLNGLHYLEEYWGPDAETFSPQRWDVRNQDSFLAKNADLTGLAGPGLEYSTVHKPVRGAYIPFSDGRRACLGKKFAQVEVVVALAALVSQYHIELAWKGDEGRKHAQRILDESATVVTLAMKEDIPLVFRER